MSGTPTFTSEPRHGAAPVSSSADNTWTAPSNAVTLLVGVSAGTKVRQLVAQGIGVTLAGMVNIGIYNGSVYRLVDQFKFLGVSGSTTASAERYFKQYEHLILPDASHSLVAWSMVASQLVVVHAFGGDLT
jgi:hypothetical protein